MIADKAEQLAKEGIYPMAGFIILTQTAFKNRLARPKSVKLDEIQGIDESSQGTWIRYIGDRHPLCVTESMTEVLAKIERCLTERVKLTGGIGL